MLIKCTSESEYRSLLAESGARPVFLLKHSLT